MYCIKCGKSSQSSDILCKNCESMSGFGISNKEQLEKKRTYGMYLGIIGNVLLLLGMVCSFLLIKNDAPADYVAQIFNQKTMGPVETLATESAENTSEEDKKSKEEQLEEKGYSFSVLEYLSRRTPDAEATEDIEVLQAVKSIMDKKGIGVLDLENEEQVNQVLGSYDAAKRAEMMDVLEYYNESNMSGVFVVIVGMLASLAAIWMATRRDYLWSLVFSFISTIPVFSLFAKMDGITAWEFEYGMYFLIGGIFAVLGAALIGGNVDTCQECKEYLPGGASYCFKCGNEMQVKKEKKHFIRDFFVKNNMIISVVGNIMMFLPVIIPVFVVTNGDKKNHMNIMGLKNLEALSEKGIEKIVLFLLILGIASLIGAVVTAIFEKNIISIGCSLIGSAAIVLAVFFVQNHVNVQSIFTFVLFPLGLFAAVAGGLNAPIDFKTKDKKMNAAKEI